METCRPWKPVTMKKIPPNCGAPKGLLQALTPSEINLVHSSACMDKNINPNKAVTNIKAATFCLSRCCA